MSSKEIRQKFLEFFEKRGHIIIPASPLVLANDPTTLFTSSGMQPLVPYLLGEVHPSGKKRLADSQPSLRLGDIEEVGDNRHTTFFEMLGNWSLGDYFKAEQLPWFWEFLTKELGLNKNRLWVSVFSATGGPASGEEGEIPWDKESFEVWQKLGVPKERIFFYGVKKNWWSRSGEPSAMPPGEIGGPDSEVFYEFTQVAHDPKFGQECHPNCDCGRFLEIGNSVFIQYQKQADGSLKELGQRNVDFGGGLERLTAACSDLPDIFMTDLFWPMMRRIEELSKLEYGDQSDDFYVRDGKRCWVDTRKSMRIIVDHLKAATMIAQNGVLPSNKAQGYVLRRLLRRSLFAARKIGLEVAGFPFEPLVGEVAVAYRDVFPELEPQQKKIAEMFCEEASRFEKTLNQGIKELEKSTKVDAKTAFYLFESFGLPFEIIQEIVREQGQELSPRDFQTEVERHQEVSRQGAQGLFRGGLADQSQAVTRLHTATHLLHQALRQVLGPHVRQEGSNITAERLRFDFSHPVKMAPEQIRAVEDLVNQKIQEALPVSLAVMGREEALRSGARAFFREKYGDPVKVYSIGPSTRSARSGSAFSREICGGPHAENTAELGRFQIIKEEAVSAGVRRIKAVLKSSEMRYNFN